jgi:hypothetical protein
LARELEVNGRTFWILSEPVGAFWRAVVLEVLDASGDATDPIGIEATEETRNAADLSAERKLRKLLKEGSN